MWLKASTFETLITERQKAVGIAQALEHQVVGLNVTLDWMRVRLNQLEHERADLLKRYMGISLPVPEVRTLEIPLSKPTDETFLNAVMNFQDVGDDEAKRLGLGWDPEGRATAHGKAID